MKSKFVAALIISLLAIARPGSFAFAEGASSQSLMVAVARAVNGFPGMEDSRREAEAEVDALLDAGADANEMVVSTPLIAALTGDDGAAAVRVAAKLLAHGADANKSSGMPPMAYLMEALLMPEAKLELTKLLLSHGADPNGLTIDGSAPLHILAAHDAPYRASPCFAEEAELAIASLLLKAGASPRLKDGGGKTALDIAKKSGNIKLSRLMSGN